MSSEKGQFPCYFFIRFHQCHEIFKFCLKMMSSKKGKFSCSFFVLLTQCYESSAPKLTNFHIFITPLPLNLTLFSRSSYLAANLKIIYETCCPGRFCEKKHRDVSKTIVIFKVKLFVALDSRSDVH